MQYSLTDLMHEEHIVLRMAASNSEEAIRMTNAVLVESGHTTLRYAEDVWKRELVYPTGLPTQPWAVAIPHADPDHINLSAIAIGILKNPVEFHQMGMSGGTILKVSFIFLLAIKEREKQVEMIQQLVSVIQDPSLLEKLITAKTPNKALMDILARIRNKEEAA